MPAGKADGGSELTPECSRSAKVNRFPQRSVGIQRKDQKLCLKTDKIQDISGSALNNDKGKIVSAG